jgi:CheY-like chemotaxis protein
MTDKKKILVIDDDKNVGAILKVKMEKKGLYEVIHAPNGREGLNLARTMAPALIVLDVNMPGLDGGDVKANLNSRPETKDIPVVFLTSLLTADEARRGKGSRPGQVMISKHLEIGEIVALIERSLPAS